MPHEMPRLGIDIGGSKIELIALARGGGTLWRRRVATPRNDYAALLDVIVQLVSECENSLRARGKVGVGFPGTTSRHSKKVINAYSTPLNDQRFTDDLSARLGRPVRLANDANCFTLSEATDGAGKDADTVLGVILGTGVGAGLVVGGTLWQGANGIAGEWGHNPLPWVKPEEGRGPLCSCGSRGHIEAWLSGPALERCYRESCSAHLSASEVVGQMRKGDRTAGVCFQDYIDRLARALASVINVLDPEVIVLGGGMSNVDELYEEVPRIWQDYVFCDHVSTRLVRNHHGDSSGVRGAAWLWPE